jgi:FAD/FMN-containing dehydrogenase
VNAYAIFSPLGGIMDRIPSSALPFPHRAGNIFDIQYNVVWNKSSDDEHYLNWMRKLYAYMAPYVSSSPRAAYVNYLDLDLGSAVNGSSTVKEAEAWGKKYFHDNFDRLVKAKTEVDPHNFFRNSQSIPPRNN